MRPLLLLFFLFTTLFAKETICLNMIVKNEAHVIKRCLNSVMPHIDYWVICDTGSTDGTQEVIKEHLKSIPGELHQRPWKNFGHNRSEAYNLAKGKGDYILFIDADDWLEYEKEFPFENLTKDSYQMWRGSDDFAYLFPQLVKGDLAWRWVGVLHEYLDVNKPYTKDVLQGVKYVSGCDGASHKDPKKFERYAQILEEGLKQEPHNDRYMFYLAESYSAAGQPLKAIEWYLNRIRKGGWEEETFWSQLQVGKLEKQLKAPFDCVVESFQKAHRMRPHRPEPIYYLAEYYIENTRYDLAYELLKGWSFTSQPEKKDTLFNELWTAKWGCDLQLSLAAYYLGHYQESLNLSNQILEQKNLPKHIKELVEANRQYPLEKLSISNSISVK